MTTELVRAKLLPHAEDDDLTVDIEAFVENHLGLPLDQYAELEPDVLGVTDFVPNERPRVSISRDLTGSALDEDDATPGLVGRWRATVAHEASHVLLHRHIFELDDNQGSLFRMPKHDHGHGHGQLQRCLKRDVGYERPISDWKEIQANMGMGVLLMPKSVFQKAARAETELLGIGENSILSGSNEHLALIDRLARRFTVSKQATRIRLDKFGIVHAAAQATL
ncbi:MAG TPA: ImmA/IrrE family metallo-endopeptidase [Woeseiaceae bacterium]|nr:ImmA/IrrE family metallo-endopeptidase [Woeseiaceae bacterium]